MGAARGPNLDADVKVKMAELIAKGWSPYTIHQQLKKDFPDQRLPTERTIYRWAKARRPAQAAPGWDWKKEASKDAALILEALGAAIAGSEGRISTFSQEQADLILKIRRAAPNLPAATICLFAQEYAAAKDTAHLDAALAVGQAIERDAGLTDAAVAAHVALHAGKWIDRPLVAFASSKEVAQKYIDKAGLHGSVAEEGGKKDFWWQSEGQFLWLLFERG